MAQSKDAVGAGGRVYKTPEDATRAGVASAARTTTANGTLFNTEDAISILGTLSITAASGTTPTLDVKLQETIDGTNFNDIGAFPQKTGVGSHARTFGPLSSGSQCRWVWTIGGTTPSFTFTIDTSARRTVQ